VPHLSLRTMNKNQLKQFLGVLAARRPSFDHLLMQANSSMVKYLSCPSSSFTGSMNGGVSLPGGPRVEGGGTGQHSCPVDVSVRNIRREGGVSVSFGLPTPTPWLTRLIATGREGLFANTHTPPKLSFLLTKVTYGRRKWPWQMGHRRG
jgi:hypothetical protein